MKRSLVALLLCLALWSPARGRAYFSSYTQLTNNSLETADWTAPTSSLYFGSRAITETITNGSFSDHSIGWTIRGDVTIADHTATIGKTPGSMLTENSLSQTIQNTSKNLSFEYQVFTTETLPGFDDPCLEVSINAKSVLHTNCSEVDEATGWQHFSIELSEFEDEQITLVFAAGNAGDALDQSWAEFRNITTNEIVGNNTQHFTIRAEDNSAIADSFIKDCDGNVRGIDTNFSFPDHDRCATAFWSVDTDGNAEQPSIVHSDIQSADPVTSSTVRSSHEPTDEYMLTLFHPNKEFAHYEILYSSEPITENFTSLTPATFSRDHNRFFLNSTQFPGVPHFAIRARDTHNNVHYFTEG